MSAAAISEPDGNGNAQKMPESEAGSRSRIIPYVIDAGSADRGGQKDKDAVIYDQVHYREA